MNEDTKSGVPAKPPKARPWTKEEIESLVYIVDQDWCWKFPGWKWVASKLDSGRTHKACREKWIRWIKSKNH